MLTLLLVAQLGKRGGLETAWSLVGVQKNATAAVNPCRSRPWDARGSGTRQVNPRSRCDGHSWPRLSVRCLRVLPWRAATFPTETCNPPRCLLAPPAVGSDDRGREQAIVVVLLQNPQGHPKRALPQALPPAGMGGLERTPPPIPPSVSMALSTPLLVPGATQFLRPACRAPCCHARLSIRNPLGCPHPSIMRLDSTLASSLNWQAGRMASSPQREVSARSL